MLLAVICACDDTGRQDDSGASQERALRCAGDGLLDFSQTGSGLDKHDGMLVWASAVQPEKSPHDASVTVLMESRIAAGAFSIRCDDSLSENMVYPSYAVVIDTDGSGDCTAGDLFAEASFYGWMDDIVENWGNPALFTSIGDKTTWGDRRICDYYVPSELL